jgi:hypothetical protein
MGSFIATLETIAPTITPTPTPKRDPSSKTQSLLGCFVGHDDLRPLKILQVLKVASIPHVVCVKCIVIPGGTTYPLIREGELPTITLLILPVPALPGRIQIIN